MPAIAKLRSTRSGWLQVSLDDERQFGLSPLTAGRLHLRVGLQLSETEAARLIEAATRDEALRRALRFLAVRPRSRAELERYLERKGYQPEVVAATVTECEGAGHLDDHEFALAFVRDRVRLRPRGAARLEAELRGRGIAARMAAAAVRQVLAEEETTERRLLDAVARKRWARLEDLEPRVARRRLEAFLRRRGFPADEIARTVRELARERAPARGEPGGSAH